MTCPKCGYSTLNEKICPSCHCDIELETKIKSTIETVKTAPDSVWRFLYLIKMELDVGGKFPLVQEISKNPFSSIFKLNFFDGYRFPVSDLIDCGLAKLGSSRESRSGATHFDTYEFVPYFEEVLKRVDVNRGDPTPRIVRILEYEIQEGTLPKLLTLVQKYLFSTIEAEQYLILLNSELDHSGAPVSCITESLPKLEAKVAQKADKVLQGLPESERLSLYSLLTKYHCDFVLAEAIGQYLWVKGLIDDFPRIPKVKSEVMNDTKNLSPEQKNVLEIVNSNTKKGVGTTAEMVQIIIHTGRSNAAKHLQNIAKKGYIKLVLGDQTGAYVSTDPNIASISTGNSNKPFVMYKGEIIDCNPYTDNLWQLNLDGKEITSISEIEGLSKLTNLGTLHLSDNQISEITGLEALTNLRHLHLRKNKITKISGLEKLTNLTELYLNDNLITKVSGLGTSINLVKLDLKNNKIANLDDAISGIKNLSRLSSLNLDGNSKFLTDEISQFLDPKTKNIIIQELLQYVFKEEKINQERMETLRGLVEISQEILLDDLSAALNMSRPELLRYLARWKESGVLLKGNALFIPNKAGLLKAIENQLHQQEQKIILFPCPACHKMVKLGEGLQCPECNAVWKIK